MLNTRNITENKINMSSVLSGVHSLLVKILNKLILYSVCTGYKEARGACVYWQWNLEVTDIVPVEVIFY